MLREKFTEELKTAMKAGQPLKTSTIRLIMAAVKERDIMARSEGNYDGVSDSEIISLLHKMIKQRQQSIEVYTQANRPELAKQEQDEIDLIVTYVPAQMTEVEVKAEISTIMAEINADGMKDMKRVIEALKEKCGDRIDMGKASGWIREKLAP